MTLLSRKRRERLYSCIQRAPQLQFARTKSHCGHCQQCHLLLNFFLVQDYAVGHAREVNSNRSVEGGPDYTIATKGLFHILASTSLSPNGIATTSP